MGVLKTIHVSCAILSFGGFFIRGIWILRGSALLQHRWVKIFPHIVDTVLLASAIIMAVSLRQSPLEQPWLAAKIVALLVYIGLGIVALGHGRSQTTRLYAWLLGLLVFTYIAAVALSKSTLGWLVYF